MSTHTPGPWTLATVSDRSIVHFCPIAAGFSLLTVVHEGSTPFGTVYSDADAYLIAAAPDLLDALQMAKHIIVTHGTHEQFVQICAAITKATGAPA